MERWEFKRQEHENIKIVNINLRQSKFWYYIFHSNECKRLYCCTYNLREQNISILFLHKAHNVLLLIRHEEDYEFVQKFIFQGWSCFMAIKNIISNKNFKRRAWNLPFPNNRPICKNKLSLGVNFKTFLSVEIYKKLLVINLFLFIINFILQCDIPYSSS